MRVVRDGNGWIVPSQTDTGKYRVTLNPPSCGCEDFVLIGPGRACKHVVAARIVHQRELGAKYGLPAEVPESSAEPMATHRPTYKQDWPKYDLAQRTEKHRFQELLFDLCRGIPDPRPEKRGRGRPQTPLADRVFASAFKVF